MLSRGHSARPRVSCRSSSATGCGTVYQVEQPSSRRVVAAGVEGMTAANAFEAAQGAADRAIFVHRLDKIRAASGLESAIAADQRAECPLIGADCRNEQVT